MTKTETILNIVKNWNDIITIDELMELSACTKTQVYSSIQSIQRKYIRNDGTCPISIIKKPGQAVSYIWADPELSVVKDSAGEEQLEIVIPAPKKAVCHKTAEPTGISLTDRCYSLITAGRSMSDYRVADFFGIALEEAQTLLIKTARQHKKMRITINAKVE